MHHATTSASAFAIAAFGLIVGLLPAPASAQIDISGYIQAEWQHFDLAEDQNDRGIYSDERKNLFLIRRGRLKASHTSDEGIQGVIQIDATERGMAIKDAYLTVPLLDSSLLDVTVGLFNKPNYEVELSSRKRESPERSQVVRAFYPGERDLGFMFTSSPLRGSFSPTLQLALFNGTGTKPEDDPYKDITARLHIPIPMGEDSDVDLAVGALYYIGGLELQDDTVVTYADGQEVLEQRDISGSSPGYGNRSHVGLELQIGLDLLPLGTTELRGEFMFGSMPDRSTRDVMQIESISNEGDSIQLFDTTFVPVPTVAIRNQAGYYVTLVQELSDHLSVAAKYDVFDRNTDLSGSDVNSTDDRASSILGFGLLAEFGPVRLTGWYEIPSFAPDEARYTDGAGVVHAEDLKDNKTTIRFQYTMK